ncbi:MAG TPA: 50S ribosomal protein L25/general stress protein Ctc [Gammaproteobacteria bacterium]
MSLSFEINAETRQDVGKGASRRLRKANKVPAVIYGAGKPPQSLVLDQDAMLRSLEHEAFYSHILTVNVDGKPQQAVLKAVQRHPYKAHLQHVDLLRTSATQKLRMHVPLHFLGEEVAPGIKAGGMLSHLLIEVEIECLPRHLPEFIEVDVSALELNDLVHLSDLKLPEGVTLPQLAQGEEHDQVVASLHLQRGGEEEGAGGETEEGGEPAA